MDPFGAHVASPSGPVSIDQSQSLEFPTLANPNMPSSDVMSTAKSETKGAFNSQIISPRNVCLSLWTYVWSTKCS